MTIYMITKGCQFVGTYEVLGCCTARAKAEQYVAWFNNRKAAVSRNYDPREAARIEILDTEDITDSSRWGRRRVCGHPAHHAGSAEDRN